jgi:hypothetical protein
MEGRGNRFGWDLSVTSLQWKVQGAYLVEVLQIQEGVFSISSFILNVLVTIKTTISASYFFFNYFCLGINMSLFMLLFKDFNKIFKGAHSSIILRLAI